MSSPPGPDDNARNLQDLFSNKSAARLKSRQMCNHRPSKPVRPATEAASRIIGLLWKCMSWSAEDRLTSGYCLPLSA